MFARQIDFASSFKDRFLYIFQWLLYSHSHCISTLGKQCVEVCGIVCILLPRSGIGEFGEYVNRLGGFRMLVQKHLAESHHQDKNIYHFS